MPWRADHRSCHHVQRSSPCSAASPPSSPAAPKTVIALWAVVALGLGLARRLTCLQGHHRPTPRSSCPRAPSPRRPTKYAQSAFGQQKGAHTVTVLIKRADGARLTAADRTQVRSARHRDAALARGRAPRARREHRRRPGRPRRPRWALPARRPAVEGRHERPDRPGALPRRARPRSRASPRPRAASRLHRLHRIVGRLPRGQPQHPRALAAAAVRRDHRPEPAVLPRAARRGRPPGHDLSWSPAPRAGSSSWPRWPPVSSSTPAPTQLITVVLIGIGVDSLPVPAVPPSRASARR